MNIYIHTERDANRAMQPRPLASWMQPSHNKHRYTPPKQTLLARIRNLFV